MPRVPYLLHGRRLGHNHNNYLSKMDWSLFDYVCVFIKAIQSLLVDDPNNYLGTFLRFLEANGSLFRENIWKKYLGYHNVVIYVAESTINYSILSRRVTH